MGRAAGETRCIVDIAGAVVACDLRIGAQRAAAIDLTCCLMFRDDPCGGFALLYPPFDYANLVKGVGAFSTPAVSHAGNHEEANPVRGCCGTSAEFDRRFVEFDARARGNLLISPTVIDEQLAAMFRERCEMRIQVVDILVDSVRLGGVTVEVEGSPVPVRILVHDVAKLVQEKIGGSRTASKTCPGELCSRLKTREQNLAG